MSILNKILGHPLTRGLPVDDPRTTLLSRRIIQDKVFLRTLYFEWYERIISVLIQKNNVLEVGSGAGFLQQLLPEVITSGRLEPTNSSPSASITRRSFSQFATKLEKS